MFDFSSGVTSLKGKTLVRLVRLTCSIAFVLFGYEQGVMGGVITGPAFTAQFPTLDTTTANGNAQLQGFTVAIYNIGSFLGGIATAIFGEKLGRKKTIMTGCLIIAIGTAIQCSSFKLSQLLVGRIITGLGNGIITSAVPVWHAELSKAENRGALITTELAVNVGGVALSYWVDYGMSFVDGSAQWRFPISLQIVFALTTIVFLFFLPESPRWLLYHDQHDKAVEILKRVHSLEEPGHAEREALQISTAIVEEKRAGADKRGLLAVFTNGEQRFFYRTALGVAMMIMQQLTGINLITYYAPYIFIKSVGFSQRLSALMSGILNLFYFLSSLLPLLLIDRYGRRVLLLGGLCGMAIGMFVLAGTTSVVGFTPGVVATVFLFVYDFSFGVGWIPGPWLLTSEYAPLAIRSEAAGLATAATWIFTFLVAEITPVAITNIAWKTYLIFGTLNVCFIPIVYFFYPETNRKTLEQIDLLFSGPKVLIDISPDRMQELEEEQLQRALERDDKLRARVGEKLAAQHVEGA